MSEATPQAVLALCGIDYIERPNRLSFSCPFHHDTDPSAGFYLDTGLAHCFSCSYTMDVTSFYAKYRDIPYKEAERELTRRFGGAPKRREIDRTRIERERARGEALLATVRPILDRKQHSFLGEQLDRILLFFERGHLSATELDTEMRLWYNDVEETHAGPNTRRTPRARFDQVDRGSVCDDGVDLE